MLTDYTTYDDVRSALGVSSDELEDVTLGLETWDHNLQFELEDINAGLPGAYATIVGIAAASRTPAQAKLYRATRYFSTLAVAYSLTASLPMFGPKDISDGKATVSRFADSPYRAVVSSVKSQYEIARDRLKDAWAESNASTSVVTARPYMSTSVPNYDPVTG
jgi:hypothetical protein